MLSVLCRASSNSCYFYRKFRCNAMVKFRIILIAVFQLFVLTYVARGQESTKYTSLDAMYYRALDLYQKEVYPAAQQLFAEFVAKSTDEVNHQKSNAAYYNAMCAIELNNADAEYLMAKFIKSYPESQKINHAYYSMGKIQYQLNKYNDAIYWLKKIDLGGLDKEQRYETNFMLGYSYFTRNDFDNANKHLYLVKDVDNKFMAPATYYYSHIAYIQKNYATALKGFLRLENDELFSPIAPFYIAQIYFLQGDYSKVIGYAPRIVRTSSTKRTPEIARIVGESYFRQKQYDSAQVYLDIYAEKSQQLTRDDYYLMGYASYQAKNYAKAAEHLERVPTTDDSLSQNTNYHLADCYLALKEGAKARQAFALASKYDFDPTIKEDALFNFAKLTYEQLYAPFNEAIDAFNRYITLYPQTRRTDEAYNYLTLAYLSTRNYKEAITALDKIQNKDATIKAAYQRAAFFRAMELFQNLQFEESIKFFDIAKRYAEYNQSIAAQTLYWQAEANYRLNSYQKAIEGYNTFVLTPGAFNLEEFNIAHYNLGYANFKLKNYNEAITWFRKFTSLSNNAATVHVGDSYNRIGDSFFIQRKYWAAIDYYDKSVAINTLDADYALFQRGFSLGLVERPDKKIESMNSLVANYPESNYVDDAIFETAESQMMLKRTAEAKSNYVNITEKYIGSSYYVKALVQLGLICYNAEQSDEAMRYYKMVVEGFPNTPEAKNALIGIRNIYVDNGDANSYFQYASTLGSLSNMSLAEKDSLSYSAAENLYVSGACDKSVPALEQYLVNYPQGNFIINANYYIADCYNRSGSKDRAIEAYAKVASGGKNVYTETSLLQLGRLYADQKRYAESYAAYDRLEAIAEVKVNLMEARVGKMRNAYVKGSYADVVTAATSVLSYDKLPAEVEREARFKMAKALLNLNRTDEALIELAKVAVDVKTKEGAEACYLKAKTYLATNELDKVEAEVFKFAERNTPHQYWLAKSFILLADMYVQKDDFFQAKATLQSVLDGYLNVNDGIIDEATNKLNELVKLEKSKQTQEHEPDTVRLRMSF